MKESQAKALETAVFAGNILLESGAELFRVEDTILRIAHTYGVASCNTFILSSGIFITAGGPHEEYFARVRHIPLGAVRLDKVEAVNQLSREIAAGSHTVDDAFQKLQEISQKPRYPRLWRVAASGLACGSFCLLFGGKPLDCIAALLIGLLLYSYLLLLEGRKFSKITVNVSGGALVTLCAFLLYKMGLGTQLGQIICGGIMPLVPGVSFTNAIRDIADGDYIAGSVRMIDALLIAFCIAGGVGLVYTFVGRFAGGVLL